MPRQNNIQFRKGTYAQWDASSSGILASGEPSFVTDFNILKIGDGTTQWGDLAAVNDNLITVVRNDTGSTIPEMSVVYINGAQGDTPRITLALAGNEGSSSKTYGLVVNDITTGNKGTVIVNGTLRNLNTNSQFSSVSEGTALWLSPTVSGGMTTTKPYAPDHSVFIGTLIRKHSQQGIINVNVQNGYELEELHNVATTGATNNQYLQYNSTNSLWIPTSSGIFSNINVNDKIQIISSGTSQPNIISFDDTSTPNSYSVGSISNGVRLLLSSNNTLGHNAIGVDYAGNNNTWFSIPSGMSFKFFDGNDTIFSISRTAINYNGSGLIYGAGGTTNYLSKFTGGSILANSLVFDNGTNVGIGTTTPSGKLDVNGTAYFGTAATSNNLYLRTGQAGISETALKLRTDASSNLYLDATNAYVKVGNQGADVDIYAGNAPIRIGNSSAGTAANQYILFRPAATEKMRLDANGNLGIGTTSPLDKIHISGQQPTVRLNNTLAYDTQLRLTDTVSDWSVGINQGNSVGSGFFNIRSVTAGANRLTINTSGLIGIGTSSPTSQLHVIGTGNFTQALQVNGTGVSISGHSHTVSDISNFGSGVSGLLPTIANSGDNRVLTSTGSTLGINAESNLTFDGQNLSAPYLLATYASGDEGGEIQLAKPPSGTLSGGVTIDAYQNKIRFFEQGGSARGFYLDLSSGGAAASTNLAGGGSATTVSNYGDNRLITSDGTSTGLNAESNFTFSGSLLTVTGSGLISSGLFLNDQTASTIASFDNNKKVTSLSTVTYPSLAELSYVKGVTSAIQTQLNNKQATLTNPVTGTGTTNYISKWTNSSGLVNSSIVDDGSQTVRFGFNQYLYMSDDWYGGEIGFLLSDQSVLAVKNSDGSFGYGGGTPGAESLVVTSAGDVGIGTNSPTAKLDVNGEIKCLGFDSYGITWIGSSDGSVGMGVNDNPSGTFGSTAAFAAFQGFNVGVTAYNPLCITAGYSPQLYLNTDGNVGINTATPSATLHVNGSGLISDSLYFADSTKSIKANGNNLDINTSDSINFKINESSALIIDGDGNDVYVVNNLGIGTTSPLTKVQAVGSLSVAADGSDVSNGNEGIILGIDGSISSNDSGPGPMFSVDATNGLRIYGDGGTGSAVILSTDRGFARIGIGTTTPDSTLHVVGDTNIDGNLTFDSFTESVVANGNSGTSKTLSLASGTVHTCTLTGNCTFTMPTATAGKSFTLFLNSGSGNYTATFTGVRWADSATPTATITASKVDIYSFISDGSFWYGSFSQNYG